MKELKTLLQNAVEDYLRQLNVITMDTLKDISDFDLGEIVSDALKAAIIEKSVEQKTKTISETQILEILDNLSKTIIGFPVGEKINSIINLYNTAEKYGYKMYYVVQNTKTKLNFSYKSIRHKEQDNEKIVSVCFVKK